MWKRVTNLTRKRSGEHNSFNKEVEEQSFVEYSAVGNNKSRNNLNKYTKNATNHAELDNHTRSVQKMNLTELETIDIGSFHDGSEAGEATTSLSEGQTKRLSGHYDEYQSHEEYENKETSDIPHHQSLQSQSKGLVKSSKTSAEDFASDENNIDELKQESSMQESLLPQPNESFSKLSRSSELLEHKEKEPKL